MLIHVRYWCLLDKCSRVDFEKGYICSSLMGLTLEGNILGWNNGELY